MVGDNDDPHIVRVSLDDLEVLPTTATLDVGTDGTQPPDAGGLAALPTGANVNDIIGDNDDPYTVRVSIEDLDVLPTSATIDLGNDDAFIRKPTGGDIFIFQNALPAQRSWDYDDRGQSREDLIAGMKKVTNVEKSVYRSRVKFVTKEQAGAAEVSQHNRYWRPHKRRPVPQM